MHFGFYLPFPSGHRALPLTYENYLNGCGFSGTEASVLEIGRRLVRDGHQVTVCTGAHTGRDVAGISYISNFTPDVLESLDFFTPLFYDTAAVHDIIGQLRNQPQTMVAIWLHCYLSDEAIRALQRSAASRSFMLIAVSRPVAAAVAHLQLPTYVVPNGISAEIFQVPSQWSMRGSHCVFFATLERGGAVAARVAKAVGRKLVFATYFNTDARHSLSKKELRRLLETCDYFIYPLVLPGDAAVPYAVHHDTYACCVHEAMAAGVIVVTWDVACFRDVYGDNVVLVPPPTCDGYDPRARFGANPAMASDAAVQLLADAVRALDSDPIKKEDLRCRARQWAFAHTWEHSYAEFGQVGR